MPMRVLRHKVQPGENPWSVHAAKVIVVLLILGILIAMLSVAFNFAAYYKASSDNQKLLDSMSLMIVEREANIARGRALETLLTQKVSDKETKDKVLIINAVISQFIADQNKAPGQIPAIQLRDEACTRLEKENVPCYPQ